MAETRDPIEMAFEIMCDDLGIEYQRPEHNGGRLDYYLPDYRLLVEVKAYPCERLIEQLESVQAGPVAVMVLFGIDSVRALRQMLYGER